MDECTGSDVYGGQWMRGGDASIFTGDDFATVVENGKELSSNCTCRDT